MPSRKTTATTAKSRNPTATAIINTTNVMPKVARFLFLARLEFIRFIEIGLVV
jgi:hypothetical protein